MVKIDKNHKQIDLRDIDLKKAKELGIKLGSISLALFLLSGCAKGKEDEKTTDVTPTITQEEVVEEKEVKVYNIVEHDPNELVGSLSSGVNFKFDDDREVDLSELTYDDLSHVIECYLVVDDDENNDYNYLNYMPNLENLKIFDNQSTKARLDNIDGSRLPGGISIDFYCASSAEFSREKFGFLEDISDIDTLSLLTVSNIDSSFVQSLKQVHNMKFNVGEFPNFTYIDMSYLDSLELSGRPYDIVMCFSTDAINDLEAAGVKVTSENLDEIKKIDKQIDDIVAGLNVDENATEQEKLNVVLTYVLTEFTYDPEVAEALENCEEHVELSATFYEEGSLDAAMTNETQICGNYAAMTSTLLKRLGVDAFNLSSIQYQNETHAWNAVKIGDYYYFVDACWLDNDYTAKYFADNDTTVIGNLSWYLEDPTELDSTEYFHTIDVMPYGLNIEDVPENVENEVRYKNIEDAYEEVIEKDSVNNEIIDIGGRKFEVTINGKIITISAAAFVGVLSALGVGKLVYDKKQNDRRRKRRYGTNSYYGGSRRY